MNKYIVISLLCIGCGKPVPKYATIDQQVEWADKQLQAKAERIAEKTSKECYKASVYAFRWQSENVALDRKLGAEHYVRRKCQEAFREAQEE